MGEVEKPEEAGDLFGNFGGIVRVVEMHQKRKETRVLKKDMGKQEKQRKIEFDLRDLGFGFS